MTFELPGVGPESKYEKLFRAVGFIVVQWGMNEQHLDLIVAVIFDHFKGHKLLKRRPTNLKDKIDLLKKCFTEFSELKNLEIESRTLFERFANASQRRNDIVHAAIEDCSQDDTFIFTKIDVVPKEHHKLRPVVFCDTEWPTFRKELQCLGKDSLSLAKRVWNTLKVNK